MPSERPFQSTNPLDAAMRSNTDHSVRELDKWHSSLMMSEGGSAEARVCLCVFMRLRGGENGMGGLMLSYCIREEALRLLARATATARRE